MPTVAEKTIRRRLAEGVMERGKLIAIRIDWTLTQGAIGTMAYLQLEAMGMDRVKTDLSISYVNHDTLQGGLESVDNHKYLQTVAMKHGVCFSRPGSEICRQVHLGRFAKPQVTPLGSDSHTPTTGSMGASAIGADGPDAACVMASMPFHLDMPNITNVWLHGSLIKGISSEGIILKVLQILGVKGGVGNVIECNGDGIRSLNIPQRITITNMGTEPGAMTSAFPSDEITRGFLKKQRRKNAYGELKANEDAVYNTAIGTDLNILELVIVTPHSLDSVLPISEVLGLEMDQVAIGNCINSSYMNIMNATDILKNKTVDPNVSLVISPGSRQVLYMTSQSGGLSDMISVGTRILESTCGPCIGMGQSPITNVLSLCTFNRNLYGGSGTLSAKVCLASPEAAAASALYGYIVGPRTVGYELPQEPEVFTINDSTIIVPDAKAAAETEAVHGPNIKLLPVNTPLEDRIDKKVMIKVGDNITTDCIAPADAKVLPYCSNTEKISEFIFMNVKASFHDDCLEYGGGFIIAGADYGQRSSREHAALVPVYLGIETVIAKSFVRIHRTNLINFSVIPFTFSNEEDYDTINKLDGLTITNLKSFTEYTPVEVVNIAKNKNFQVFHGLTQRDIETMLAGGALNLIRRN